MPACVTFNGSSVAGGFFASVGKLGVFCSPKGMGPDQVLAYNEAHACKHPVTRSIVGHYCDLICCRYAHF